MHFPYPARTTLASLFLSLATDCADAQAQDETERRAWRRADLQLQLEQLQQQAQQRQRLQQAPDGRLPDPDIELTTRTDLPTEQLCFPIDTLQLALPEQLPPAQRRMGASQLQQDPFHFLLEAMAPYRGRCMGHAGIDLVQRRLSTLILSRGYSTTRLGIAPQNLSTRTLVFTLIPGIIHKIHFSGSDSNGSWKTAFPARPGDLLNLRELEQGLEQLRRVPSQSVDMQIVPGNLPGESDIVIDRKRDKPWRLALTFNDSGARATGRWQASLLLALYDPLGLNDLLHLGMSTDADRRGRERGTTADNFSYSLPYGNWTFFVLGNRYNYHQQIAGLFQTVTYSGRGRSLEVTIDSLFQRNRQQKNHLQFKLGKRWTYAYLDDFEMRSQRRNASHAELAWLHRHYIGAAQLDMRLANRWGVGWFNGDADSPRRAPGGPTRRYTLQTVDATLLSPFKLAGRAATYSLTLRGQMTQTALYASEQLSIGNRYTVRGFDGELGLSAERGWFARNEIGLPLNNDNQTVYLGLDFGKVAGPAVQDLLGDKLAGTALGMRGALKGIDFDVFLGWALYKPRGFRTGSPTVGLNLAYWH